MLGSIIIYCRYSCVLGPTLEPAVSMAGGVIAAIILGIHLLIGKLTGNACVG